MRVTVLWMAAVLVSLIAYGVDVVREYGLERCENGDTEGRAGEDVVSLPPLSTSPPFYIRESRDDAFLSACDRVHSFTHRDGAVPFILWTNERVYDFSFIRISHVDVGGKTYFFTWETLFTMEVLLPTDALLLDILFGGWLYPYVGFSFVDADHQRHYRYIRLSMADEGPLLSLHPFEDRTSQAAQEDDNGIYPNAAQQALIAQLLGDFSLGEVIMAYPRQEMKPDWDERWGEVFEHYFRFVLYDLNERRSHFAGDVIFPWHRATSYVAAALREQGLTSALLRSASYPTREGDVLLAHSAAFNDTWLLIDIGGVEDSAERRFVRVELGG